MRHGLASWMKEQEYKEVVDVLGKAIRSHAHPDYDDILRRHPRRARMLDSASRGCQPSAYLIQPLSHFLHLRAAAACRSTASAVSSCRRRLAT